MRRRLIIVGVLAMVLAGCGDSSATASPTGSSSVESVAPSSDSGASMAPSESQSPSEAPIASQTASGSTSTAICDAISLRKSASTSSSRVASINSGTAVHIVGTVHGTAYTAGSCGTSGSSWLKIDKVAGKSAKASYGVTYVYAAAGFFE
jgi:hypothetical protein